MVIADGSSEQYAIYDPLSCSRMTLHDIPLDFTLKGDKRMRVTLRFLLSRSRLLGTRDPLSLRLFPLGCAPEGDCELFFFRKNVVRSAMLWTGTDEKGHES